MSSQRDAAEFRVRSIHLHCLVLDGVYRCGADGAPGIFHVDAPTDDELHPIPQTSIAWLMKMLTYRGVQQLCRYITRPALSAERVQLNAAGQVELKLKTPWRGGTTHLAMSPLAFMQRLAALVLRPRLQLIRFRGVVAPSAKLRGRTRGPLPRGDRRAGSRQAGPWARVGDAFAPAQGCRVGTRPQRATPDARGSHRLVRRLGDPARYGRMGFTSRPEQVHPGLPPEHFVAVVLLGQAPGGEVTHHPVFSVRP